MEGSSKRLLALLATAALAAACGGQNSAAKPSAQPTRSAPVSASARPPAIDGTVAVYDRVVGSQHVVTLVRVGGSNELSARLLSSSAFARRSPSQGVNNCPLRTGCGGALEPQYVSTSDDKVYVLDGDSTVDVLDLDGTRHQVARIPGTETVPAAFAVSPDDKQIAVATLDPKGQALYIERLGGGHRVDLSAPGPMFYWPIGWHEGEVVLGASNGFGSSAIPLNAFGAGAYGLIDPHQGGRFIAIGSTDCEPTGFLSAGGTACATDFGQPCLGDVAAHVGGRYYYSSCLRRIDWSGHETVFLLPNDSLTKTVVGAVEALSPNGRAIVTAWRFIATEPDPRAGAGNQFAWGSGYPSDEQPDIAWIDASHVSWNGRNGDGTSSQRLVDIGAGYASVSGVAYSGPPIRGVLVATMPAAL